MAEPGDQDIGGGAGGVDVVRINSKVMVAAAVFLFMVVVFVFFLYLYARRYFRPNPALRGRSRTRFVFAAADIDPAPRRGLDAAVLCSLPVTVYRAADFEEGLECAVCLCELVDGEEARLLPKCGHGFHLECIDMWFHSHSTCPLCRGPVGAEPSANPDAGAEATEAQPPETVRESLVFPPNPLFCGDQDQANAENSSTTGEAEGDGSPEGPSTSSGSSSSKKPQEGRLVIEMPRRVVDEFPSRGTPLPSSRFAMEDTGSPVTARFRSLRRLWSLGGRTAGSPCSPRVGDIEQALGGGEGRALPPKSPANS
ncbi:RING-H2 finger protein ATL60-like [Musa acuminata AAA Group]|uniref:RING-H2 finger protein ATL60 n=1 Tax=Musa acuminata AAA Group TaxID=214697 RepID=UPI0031E0370E